jgi:hypothetical protein
MSTVVVYVHGLWQRGAESRWLRRRLAQELKAEARAFSYPSVTADAADIARNICHAIELRADTLLGRSQPGRLGDLESFEDGSLEPQLPRGRIVLMGSPLGAAAPRATWPPCRSAEIMGRWCARLLVSANAAGRACGNWGSSRRLGLGIGRITGPLGGTNDGTVLIEETRLEGAADHVVLRVSHTGMLFAPAVARAAGAFLSTGRFSR